MKVVLIGYMGSGKSTIGKTLAKTLEYDFIDLDDYMIAKEKMTIPQIFGKKGELYFRKKEHQYLQELLELNRDVVIALGGGTPCYGSNMDLILDAEDTTSFYLKASIPALAERLFGEKKNRPLISHLDKMDDLKEYIGKHLFERGFYYSRSQFSIVVDAKTEKDIIEEMVFHLF